MHVSCEFPVLSRVGGAHPCVPRFPVSPCPFWHESGTAWGATGGSPRSGVFCL